MEMTTNNSIKVKPAHLDAPREDDASIVNDGTLNAPPGTAHHIIDPRLGRIHSGEKGLSIDEDRRSHVVEDLEGHSLAVCIAVANASRDPRFTFLGRETVDFSAGER